MAAGLLIAVFRIPGSLGALERVLVLFTLSGIGAGAFLIGRAHARCSRDRRNSPPHPGS